MSSSLQLTRSSIVFRQASLASRSARHLALNDGHIDIVVAEAAEMIIELVITSYDPAAAAAKYDDTIQCTIEDTPHGQSDKCVVVVSGPLKNEKQWRIF